MSVCQPANSLPSSPCVSVSTGSLQVIWGIILGMLAMLAYSIIRNSAFPQPTGVRTAGCGLGTVPEERTALLRRS